MVSTWKHFWSHQKQQTAHQMGQGAKRKAERNYKTTSRALLLIIQSTGWKSTKNMAAYVILQAGKGSNQEGCSKSGGAESGSG